jgi:hypothetical protein
MGRFKNTFTAKGACAAIVNMTLEAFKRYERDLLSEAKPLNEVKEQKVANPSLVRPVLLC